MVLQQGDFSWANGSPLALPNPGEGALVGCTPWLTPAPATGNAPSRVSPPHLGVTSILIFPKLFGYF